MYTSFYGSLITIIRRYVSLEPQLSAAPDRRVARGSVACTERGFIRAVYIPPASGEEEE